MCEIFAQKKYGWHKKMGTRKLKRMLGLAVFFFSWLIFVFWLPKKNPSANGRKVFFWFQKNAKIAIF
jgi:hypothetical protein